MLNPRISANSNFLRDYSRALQAIRDEIAAIGSTDPKFSSYFDPAQDNGATLVCARDDCDGRGLHASLLRAGASQLSYDPQNPPPVNAAHFRIIIRPQWLGAGDQWYVPIDVVWKTRPELEGVRAAVLRGINAILVDPHTQRFAQVEIR